jgi:hypothetical protein
LNIRRRHLTKEQQAELIVKAIDAAKPKAPIDRATSARSFNPTPKKKGGSTKDPVLDKAVTEAKKHGISKRTVQNARAKLQGKTPAPKKTDTPKAQRVTKADVEAAKARTQSVHDAVRYTADQASAAIYSSARIKLMSTRDGNPVCLLARRLIDVGYKAVARELHPDRGGSTERMIWLTAARDHLKQGV